MNVRTGIGVDVHRLVAGRPMTVAGVLFDDDIGPEGHSDGDVAAHAACDALLSAAGLGDLGSNYGTAEPAGDGGAGGGLRPLRARRVRAAGGAVENVAVQVIGNTPKIGPRRVEAEQVLSEAVGAPVSV